MSLRDEIERDFASLELDEDLFEPVTLEGMPRHAMVDDSALLTAPNDDGGGLITDGEKDFKFRRADGRVPSKGDLVCYGAERYRIYSITDRPGHPLILTRGRLEGARWLI